MDPGPHFTDERTVDMPLDQARGQLPAILQQAFGTAFQSDGEEGRALRGRLRRGGKYFDIAVETYTTGNETRIALRVEARRAKAISAGLLVSRNVSSANN